MSDKKQQKQKKKSSSSTFILLLIFFVGLSVLLYPSISNYWNSFVQSQAISSYADAVENLDEEKYQAMLADAVSFNNSILRRRNVFVLNDKEKEKYESILNLTGNGVIGYIEIPSIDCTMPIYHGTSESVLQIAAGHIEWTSLPVGGENTHCVISGHRGLPSAKLFTDLDKLSVGDTFMIRVLDEVLTYEVVKILIIEPGDVTPLQIEDGADYCTLLTCTPYGVNSHRLLLRGQRTETVQHKSIYITSEAYQIDTLIVTPVVALPMLLILMIIVLVKPVKKKSKY